MFECIPEKFYLERGRGCKRWRGIVTLPKSCPSGLAGFVIQSAGEHFTAIILRVANAELGESPGNLDVNSILIRVHMSFAAVISAYEHSPVGWVRIFFTLRLL
jgi:hypothetical protein